MLKTLIDRPITVTMGLLVIMVLGIVSIRQLPVSLIPEIDVPNITVQVSAPDMSSKEIDEAVLRPLRQNLMQISNLDEFKSEAKDGLGIISLSFTVGSDMDYAFIEVNEKIDRSMSALGDVERPKVYKSSASDIPAFYVNLTLKNQGTIPPDKDTELYPVSDAFSQLSTFASEVISKRIEQLPEVAHNSRRSGIAGGWHEPGGIRVCNPCSRRKTGKPRYKRWRIQVQREVPVHRFH